MNDSPPTVAGAPRKPVLAILTVDDEQRSFRGNRQNFADLISTGEKLGFVTYVVTVKNFKLKSPTLPGYTYHPREKIWVRGRFPYPDIVYNRIPQREDERQPSVKRKLDALAGRPELLLFNRRFFNKWTLYKWLSASRITRKWVPETRRLTRPAVLTSMLHKYSFLFLKPVRGKAGVGIMTVRVLSEKKRRYRLQIQEDQGSKTYRYKSLKTLWRRVCRESLLRGEPYIAQQGIPLATAGKKRFDLRALVQKNGEGRWEVTGIGARVAGDDSITTHVPRGGHIEEPEKLLTAAFGGSRGRQMLGQAGEAALTLARQIERSARTLLGEMSMDLGIDESGRIWFFEANSKPMKFDEPHIRKKSLERIFQYSLHLYRTKKKKSAANARR
jgi:hypothetical protein